MLLQKSGVRNTRAVLMYVNEILTPKEIARQKAKIRASIAAARKEVGLSQKQLSLRISRSSTLMQKIEAGTRDVSALDVIVIARTLGMEPGELLQRAL